VTASSAQAARIRAAQDMTLAALPAPDGGRPSCWLAGSRVRSAAFSFRFDARRHASRIPGTVVHVSCGEDGRLGFDVWWDRPSPQECLALGWHEGGPRWSSHVDHAAWLAGEDVKRDADGWVIEDSLPDPAVANFTASVISFGCAWSGDVRETAAWHAEQPGRSGWWDALAP
jgi:hypothetical protein